MKGFIVILSFFIAFNGYAQSERKFIRRGNREFEDKKYPDAEIQFRKALEKSPGSSPAIFNLGNSLYKENHYDAAAEHYRELTGKAKTGEATSDDFYNLGNALFKSGKYQECIEAYKNALRKSPGDMDAKQNLQLAMSKLQQQQQNKNQDSKDQKNKDQKNKDQKNKQDNNQANKDSQKQDKNQQNKDSKGNDKQNQKQNISGQISPQDAERILQALENEEKNVLKRVQDQQKHNKKVPVEKNW